MFVQDVRRAAGGGGDRVTGRGKGCGRGKQDKMQRAREAEERLHLVKQGRGVVTTNRHKQMGDKWEKNSMVTELWEERYM